MKALARYQHILLGKQRHNGVNNLPKVVARQCRGRKLNPWSADHETETVPLHHRSVAITLSHRGEGYAGFLWKIFTTKSTLLGSQGLVWTNFRTVQCAGKYGTIGNHTQHSFHPSPSLSLHNWDVFPGRHASVFPTASGYWRSILGNYCRLVMYFFRKNIMWKMFRKFSGAEKISVACL